MRNIGIYCYRNRASTNKLAATETDYADGSNTKVQYNAIGKQSATIDALNRTTSYTDDSLGRLTTTAYPDTTTESATFDAENHRLTSTDRAGHTTSYTYDADGRLSQTTYADGKFTKTHYDAAGRVDSTTDANSNVTSYGYDDAERRTTITDALNHVTTFAYDNAGNQILAKDAKQNLTQYQVRRREPAGEGNLSRPDVLFDELRRAGTGGVEDRPGGESHRLRLRQAGAADLGDAGRGCWRL